MTALRSTDSHTAYISVGSNLGNRKQNCLNGIEKLTGSGRADLVAESGFYETEPMDYADQDWFVNAVVKVKTDLDPLSLLHELLTVETDLGRRRNGVRFGPRIIDLDLILYNRQVIESSELVVPHPRMHKRRFVLEPICDIDPELPHPVLNMTMRQLLVQPEIREQKLTRLMD